MNSKYGEKLRIKLIELIPKKIRVFVLFAFLAVSLVYCGVLFKAHIPQIAGVVLIFMSFREIRIRCRPPRGGAD